MNSKLERKLEYLCLIGCCLNTNDVKLIRTIRISNMLVYLCLQDIQVDGIIDGIGAGYRGSGSSRMAGAGGKQGESYLGMAIFYSFDCVTMHTIEYIFHHNKGLAALYYRYCHALKAQLILTRYCYNRRQQTTTPHHLRNTWNTESHTTASTQLKTKITVQ